MSDDESSATTHSGIGLRRAQAQDQKNAGYEDRRTAIIEAAAARFRRQGYGATNLAQIAEDIGTDRASLYYYFSSKEELFDVLVTDVVKANLAIAEEIRDGSGTAPEKLHRFIVQLMTSYAEHYPFLYVYLQENMAHVVSKRQAWAEEMRAVNRRYEQAVTDLVQQGMDEGTIKQVGDPQVLAFGVMGMVSWTHRWFNPQTSAVTAREIGEAYAETLLNGMRSAPSARDV